jgi:tetratricopeptide (TPR) repeat protein
MERKNIMSTQDPIIGKRVGGYRVTTFITHGSYGPIYYAERSFPTDRSVVVKLLYSLRLDTQSQYDQFLQEVQVLKALKHPHVLPVFDADLYNDIPYLVTGYAPKASLRYRLWQLPGHILPLSEAVNILARAGQALHYAHQQGIIHGNLKPENILFDAEGEVLLADFGIATLAATSGPHHRNSISTAPYMAPEQFDGVLSSASDQYALGCIAYEAMTGRFPFTAPDVMAMRVLHKTAQPVPPIQLNPNFLVHIEQAILKAMAKQWNDRHVDVSAFTMSLYLLTGETSQKTKVQWLENGHALREAKRYEEALIAYERAIQLDRNYVAAHYNKGTVLYYLGRYEAALAAYERAIQLKPDYVYTYIDKGLVLAKLNRYEAALAAYEQAIQRDPAIHRAHHAKGRALIKLKSYKEALAALKEAIRLDATCCSTVYIDAGIALRGLKRYEEALTNYEQAIKLNPEDAIAYINKADVLCAIKSYEEALTACEQAIQLTPAHPVAYDNTGEALHGLKRYEEALVAYARAAQLNPQDAFPYEGRGKVLYDLKRYEEALAAFEHAIGLDSEFATAYINKGKVLRVLQRYEEALAAYERAIQLDPDNAEAYNGKGNALGKLERYQEALTAYEVATILAPKNPVSYVNLGDTLFDLKRYNASFTAYEDALRLDPNLADAHHGKGNALEQLGRLEEARQAYERAVALGYSDRSSEVLVAAKLFQLTPHCVFSLHYCI